MNLQGNDIVLYVSLAVLLLSLAVWVQQRGAAARRRAERARRAAAREQLGGDSYFLPPASIDQAVELASPVEIESLLAGEPDTVAQLARRQLEESTDIDVASGVRELSFGLSVAHTSPPPRPEPVTRKAAPAAAPVAAPAPISAPVPARAPAPVSAPVSAPLPARGLPTGTAAQTAAALPLPTGTPSAPSGPPLPSALPRSGPAAAPAAPTAGKAPARPGAASEHIPARELVLAWFEARGYRATAAATDTHPIELILRHRRDVSRSYAFAVERAVLTEERAAQLQTRARAAGMDRLLIAAEAGWEEGVARSLKRYGVRALDEAAIRAELAKIDLSVAAKIIAVARGRAKAWHSAPTAPPATPAGRQAR